MPASQLPKILLSLESERSRTFDPYYEPVKDRLQSWIKLRGIEPETISHYAFKKRACRYVQKIYNHSKELFTLYALTILWSTLGSLRTTDEALEIIKWWDKIEHPHYLEEILEKASSRLSGPPSKRAKTSESSPTNNFPEFSRWCPYNLVIYMLRYWYRYRPTYKRCARLQRYIL
ncbi:hypothetical protein M501DRAFT_1001433 [Patellaria atrata CBS 101060]|uniref:Uncharacterized protein n=1 Tax=Patellaria atrata CBS 101060 TaxID=1346257 RepID=A0A9P4S355_9PEZI|nr:hypothetical protein M501DRAFT_1001433 [Patellaria atrata CBS 101060]